MYLRPQQIQAGSSTTHPCLKHDSKSDDSSTKSSQKPKLMEEMQSFSWLLFTWRQEIYLPETTNNLKKYALCHVADTFNEYCWYNIIFGAESLDKFGFTINLNVNVLQWVEHEIPLKDSNKFYQQHYVPN